MIVATSMPRSGSEASKAGLSTCHIASRAASRTSAYPPGRPDRAVYTAGWNVWAKVSNSARLSSHWLSGVDQYSA